jgi:hypothetical protein
LGGEEEERKEGEKRKREEERKRYTESYQYQKEEKGNPATNDKQKRLAGENDISLRINAAIISTKQT